MGVAVQFDKVSKHFGSVKAVDQVDLAIKEGEFFAMLGPSGSGKTTCLRLIAGFNQPSTGSISIFGEAVEEVPPYRRSVNTVFQDYALFPHLNVADNVAYALMIKKVGNKERLQEAARALEMVRLTGYGERRPSELSGGQRQRVALARALISKPRVLLLDEPLGALDLKLREEMQEELRELQRALGITFVFVTHDQTEALSMADRVAVFNEGRIAQLGTPEEIYHHPSNAFVAGFVGASNILSADQLAALGLKGAAASLRPEALRIVSDGGRAAEVVAKSFQGSSTKLVLKVAGLSLNAQVDYDLGQRARVGETLFVDWDAEALHIMRPADE